MGQCKSFKRIWKKGMPFPTYEGQGLLSFLEIDKPEYQEILFSNWKEVRMQLMYTQTHRQVYQITDPVDIKWKSHIHTTIYN